MGVDWLEVSGEVEEDGWALAAVVDEIVRVAAGQIARVQSARAGLARHRVGAMIACRGNAVAVIVFVAAKCGSILWSCE